MDRNSDWNNCKNILCIRPDNLGDVLMTSPAFRALKESFPDRKLTLLTSRAGQAIAKFIPEIDKIIAFDIPWYKHDHAGSSREVLDIVARLKAGKFDGAIIFTVFSQNPLPTAMLCYLAGIPRVAGYCRENPYKLITDWFPDKEPVYKIKHEVIRQLDLVSQIGAIPTTKDLRLTVTDRAKTLAAERLQDLGIKADEPWILLHPGVSEAKRQYPVTLFAKAVKVLTDELGLQVLLTGVDSEQSLGDQIVAKVGSGVHSLIGKLEMEALIGLIARAPLLIANNTGPVHIAAAVNTPTVVLYAMTNPQHTPWMVPHRVLTFDVPKAIRSKNVIISQANDKAFKENKGAVAPEEIISAVKDLLGIPAALKTMFEDKKRKAMQT